MKKELFPTSEMDTVSYIGEQYLEEVRSYAEIGCNPQCIANLIGLARREKLALVVRISLPGDIYNDAYNSGRVLGEFNIDKKLVEKANAGDIEAITLLEERKNQRVELDLRKQLFGV